MEASRAATRTYRSYETTSGKTAATRLSLLHLGDEVIGERTTAAESPTGSSVSGPRAPGLVIEAAFVRKVHPACRVDLASGPSVGVHHGCSRGPAAVARIIARSVLWPDGVSS